MLSQATQCFTQDGMEYSGSPDIFQYGLAWLNDWMFLCLRIRNNARFYRVVFESVGPFGFSETEQRRSTTGEWSRQCRLIHRVCNIRMKPPVVTLLQREQGSRFRIQIVPSTDDGLKLMLPVVSIRTGQFADAILKIFQFQVRAASVVAFKSCDIENCQASILVSRKTSEKIGNSNDVFCQIEITQIMLARCGVSALSNFCNINGFCRAMRG